MARTAASETILDLRVHPPAQVDTRMALRVYAALLGLAGVATTGWGPVWLGAHMQELPWGRAALIRLVGSVFMATGLAAVGLSNAEAHERARLLLWFIAAHAIIWVMLVVQIAGPLGDVALANHASWAMLSVIIGLVYVRFPSDWQPQRAVSVLHAPESSSGDAPVYSGREHQIREAAAQEERNRLARDLHDAVKQQIFAIQTSAATAETRLDTDPAGVRDALTQVRRSAREAMAEMEAMLDQLRVAPLGTTGLVEAIRKQCEALAFRTGATVDVMVGQLPHETRLPPGTHQAIFRIMQEALANVGRHARARHVQVSLGTSGDRLDVMVRDDGQGFDRNGLPGGMGIQNMHARARELGGSIDVHSAAGGGTVLTLVVPIEAPQSQRALERRAQGRAGLMGLATVLLLVNLIRNGPGLGNVSLIVFALLFIRHVRTLQRLRHARASAAARSIGRES